MCDLLVADVSGRGFGPALIMVGTRRTLRTCAQMHEDVSQILTIANRTVAEDTLQQHFVTMFYARLEPASRTLTYTAAGHPGFVLNGHGDTTTLESSGMPLGLLPENTYEVGGSVKLQPGDIVVLMTNGAWEAAAPDGAQFGQQRIFEFIHQNRDQTAAEILELLLEAIGRFCHPGEVRDDVTLVLVKVGE